jgi:5-formyltetrahydrofolate cyclo-ligase
MQVAFPDSANPKNDLRAAMRRLLREQVADSAALHPAIGHWLAAHPERQTIAIFSALPGEVDLTEIIAAHPARRWVWPRVVGDDLHFHQVENPDSQLIPGAFGIREPSPELPVIPVDEIDAFFCPGLAFDPRGGRLGRGRGFYDRMLSKARPDSLKIGLCFPWQIVADTFPEAHDVIMDEVLSAVSPPHAQL